MFVLSTINALTAHAKGAFFFFEFFDFLISAKRNICIAAQRLCRKRRDHVGLATVALNWITICWTQLWCDTKCCHNFVQNEKHRTTYVQRALFLAIKSFFFFFFLRIVDWLLFLRCNFNGKCESTRKRKSTIYWRRAHTAYTNSKLILGRPHANIDVVCFWHGNERHIVHNPVFYDNVCSDIETEQLTPAMR